jgi:hypothetical protein
MSWVDEEYAFKLAYHRALECAATDSGRLRTSLQKLTFDNVDTLTNQFSGLVQNLLEWSGDDECAFVVLRPDPVYYFHHFFGKYATLGIKRGMSNADYLAALNEEPPDSPADALGTNYSEYAITPPSQRWFIHTLRSVENDGGHLWIPSEWVDKVAAVYPYATVAASV